MQTFTVAGVSTLNNTIKLRFANNLQQRIKTLQYNAHTNIVLVQLNTACTKLQAAQYLLTHSAFTAHTALIQQYIAQNSAASASAASASAANASAQYAAKVLQRFTA